MRDGSWAAYAQSGAHDPASLGILLGAEIFHS
jgi:hypothetical protein